MPLPDDLIAERKRVAARYLSGSGIEIGALDAPTTLAQHYPELDPGRFVKVDVLDDGERLTRFNDASLDFVIANHMLEHCENPLGTLRHHLRRVKPGGMLFYAVPDMRMGFDRARPMTPFEHLVADDADGGAASRRAHYLEWARFVNNIEDEAEMTRAAENQRFSYSIHFHVWDANAWLDFLGHARDYLERSFETRYFEFTGTETISVLRRS